MMLSDLHKQRIVRRIKPTSNCWLWTGGKNDTGYGTFNVNGKTYRVHRLIYEMHFGIIPIGMWVLHKCDNPPCVNPMHLFLGTCADNNADMVKKGRLVNPIGIHHGRAKLNNQKVRTIRQLANGGMTMRQIGDKIGVSHGTIADLLRGRTWSHVL